MTSGMESGLEAGSADVSPPPPQAGASIFYDGTSSRRHSVELALNERLEILENGIALAAWPYSDIRRADSAVGILRLSCQSAPPLARLEIRDSALGAILLSRCPQLEAHAAGRHSITPIVGWSLAATVSIVAVIWFALPLVADRLAPLVPPALERRIGDASEKQIATIFGSKTCNDAAGSAAFAKLIRQLSTAAGFSSPIRAAVLNTPVPNAFALPGGKVYLFSGLLSRSDDPDEIAGVLAHELGHVVHRDNTRNMIYSGGTSFLIGLLFGDVTGSGALIFASRSLVTASYSREAEQNADDFSISVMHKLGRPTKPMGDLIFRITGNEGDKTVSFLANHPLTEDRLKHLSDENRAASGPPLLSDKEWAALKAVCKAGS
ncbi:MAG TPA: M48 family metallopeptidase [Bradyrhizobium sp.]|uniref:M48 family metallopeptidase n=1 Tax=Bradyrhizobium sp. TaxID=376 RepID=UPI002D7E1A11|nr:M48 family metallopeptidase [Bradyrhizobium sp.]HET7887980.1 M48 family metallopeptidase [Bradyrhizobium sp.]